MPFDCTYYGTFDWSNCYECEEEGDHCVSIGGGRCTYGTTVCVHVRDDCRNEIGLIEMEPYEFLVVEKC